MLAGIGVTIVLGQLHVVLGGEQQDDAIANVLELPGQLISLHGPATRARPRRHRDPADLAAAAEGLPGWVHGVPAPLLAVVAVTVVAVLFALPVDRVEVGGSLLEAITPPVLPELPRGVVVGVFTVAIIASSRACSRPSRWTG